MFVDRRYKNFIIDMDGVIYRGNTPLPHSAEFINFLREIDAKVVFFSNNSTLSRKQYVEKLSNMGIKAREEEIVSSGLITAYCLSKENPGAFLYVIGEEGLREELGQRGMNLVEVPPYQVDGVVVGMDRQFNFKKMSNAMRCILNGASFYGTNPDPSFPTEDGFMPGCGAILASIEVSSGVKPRVFGKPYPESLQFLLEITGFEKEETVIVGDRLDTDIKLAEDFGLFSILVLTGVSKKEDLAHFSARPDMVVENLGVLKELLSQNREVK